MLRLSLHHTPPVAPAAELAVVIDVLRWTSTCVVALANGAAGIEAFLTPEEARRRAQEIGALTAGERNAHRIPGFDLGNSPTEFTRYRVEGRIICATTTNGTRALLAAQGAPRVYLAACVNLSATAAAIREAAPDSVAIICAGSDGQPAPEDSACADALAALLRGEPPPDPTPALFAAPHATHLRALGYARDVELAAAVDTHPIVVGVQGGMIRVTR